MAGDAPDGRIELEPLPDSAFITPFEFLPGETVYFQTQITPYDQEFQEGGLNIVFVLRANTKGFNLKEVPFHPRVFESLRLHYQLDR